MRTARGVRRLSCQREERDEADGWGLLASDPGKAQLVLGLGGWVRPGQNRMSLLGNS